jgi:CheY-like chemotaxis protein
VRSDAARTDRAALCRTGSAVFSGRSARRRYAAAASSFQPNQEVAMARILVIDDRADVAYAISKMLFGHETQIETDPRTAVMRMLGGEPFDIVLIDFNMPEMSGREVSDVLAGAQLARPPIVLIMSGGENVESLFETGRGVLIKPFAGPELRDLVSEMLHDAPASRTPRPRPSA